MSRRHGGSDNLGKGAHGREANHEYSIFIATAAGNIPLIFMKMMEKLVTFGCYSVRYVPTLNQPAKLILRMFITD